MTSRTSRTPSPSRRSRPARTSRPARATGAAGATGKPAKRRAAPAAAPASDFAPVFAGLKRLLVPYGRRMEVKHDGPGIYYLESSAANRYGEPVFFGAVRTGKRYVSYHLFPLYVFPDLARKISRDLKSRMQGKACFNFRTVDRALFAELKELTARGYEQFQRGGVFGR